MARFLFTLAVYCLPIAAAAQTTRLEIINLPEGHSAGSSIYIAGSFNGWNPRHEQYKFQTGTNGNPFIELKLANGVYEYKITRGGWDKVECSKGGAGIANRQLVVDNDGSIVISIEEWQDRFSAGPPKTAASLNVQVLDTAFFIPQLNKVRRVWVYLPEDYTATGKRYPVLYMHDGQNVFEDSSSFSGEWGVDEYMDTAIARRSIVVAVDHGGQDRILEYCPYDMERFGKASGDQYADFLVKTLRPYINKKFRTRKCRKNTFIAGSSLGGLISMYTMLKYPGVFGGAGIFSPAFWIGPKIFDEIKAKGKRIRSRIYFYAGLKEGETMVPLTLKAFEEMAVVSRSKMRAVIRQDGKHNEAAWRKEFPLFYEWMMN